MLFELWAFENGHFFIERTSDEAAYRRQLALHSQNEVNVDLAWSVEAGSWNEAMQALYDRKGWGRYRTFEEDLSDPPRPG